MHIMLQADVLASAAVRNRVVEDVLAVLNQGGGLVVVIQGVDIPADHVVSERREVRQAGSIAVAVRRAHVRRDGAKHLSSQLLDAGHLRSPVIRGDSVEIGVVPGVGADLVAGVDHAPEHVGVGSFADLAEVVAVDEESDLGAVAVEEVEQGRGVDEGAVVKGDGDGAGHRACGDVHAWEGSVRRVVRGGAGKAGPRSGEGGWGLP